MEAICVAIRAVLRRCKFISRMATGLFLIQLIGREQYSVIAAPPALAYLSQDSAKSFMHSGIKTSTGTVWDGSTPKVPGFMQMVSAALPDNDSFSEVSFAFMQCYGAGMIDELQQGLNLSYASYTSAARWNQKSIADANDPLSGGKFESLYNVPYASNLAGTQRNAATQARANDVVGPFQKLKFDEDPQYTSSGLVGDNITLHAANSKSSIVNNKYLAVVFGGSTTDDKKNNENSVARITAALADLKYTKAEERIINPKGSAKQLMDAWKWVGANVTPTTQVFYWNSWGHGNLAKDLKGQVEADQQKKNQQVGLQSGATYSFDLPNDFSAELQEVFNYYSQQGDTAPLDSPYFEVQSATPISNVQVTVNGRQLSSIGTSDLYDDGTVLDYWFGLDGSDISTLSTNISDSFSLSWSGPPNPDFGLVDINVGDVANGVVTAVPEPTAIFLLAGASIPAMFFKFYRKRESGGID